MNKIEKKPFKFDFDMPTCSLRKCKSWFYVFLINIFLLPGGGEEAVLPLATLLLYSYYYN